MHKGVTIIRVMVGEKVSGFIVSRLHCIELNCGQLSTALELIQLDFIVSNIDCRGLLVHLLDSIIAISGPQGCGW